MPTPRQARGTHATASRRGPARVAGDRAATGDFATIRRRTGTPTAQRVLGPNSPILGADVQSVTQLDAKVWLLEGHHNDAVVVKIEVAMGAEPPARFEERRGHVQDLAANTLPGVPVADAVTPADLAVIAALDPAVVGADAGQLAQCAAQPGNLVFVKVAKVDMGRHLQHRVAAAEAAVAARLGKRGPVSLAGPGMRSRDGRCGRRARRIVTATGGARKAARRPLVDRQRGPYRHGACRPFPSGATRDPCPRRRLPPDGRGRAPAHPRRRGVRGRPRPTCTDIGDHPRCPPRRGHRRSRRPRWPHRRPNTWSPSSRACRSSNARRRRRTFACSRAHQLGRSIDLPLTVDLLIEAVSGL